MSEWLSTRDAHYHCKGEIEMRQLNKLCMLRIIPAVKRPGQRPWYIRPWLLDAHRAGYIIDKVPADIGHEEFEAIKPMLRRME